MITFSSSIISLGYISRFEIFGQFIATKVSQIQSSRYLRFLDTFPVAFINYIYSRLVLQSASSIVLIVYDRSCSLVEVSTPFTRIVYEFVHPFFIYYQYYPIKSTIKERKKIKYKTEISRISINPICNSSSENFLKL